MHLYAEHPVTQEMGLFDSAQVRIFLRVEVSKQKTLCNKADMGAPNKCIISNCYKAVAEMLLNPFR